MSAESFLECTAADTTDCLILGLRLAGVTGLELQEELLGFIRRIPVVFITSHDDKRSRQLAKQAGAVGCLDKPVDTEALSDTIQKSPRTIMTGTHR